MPMNYFKLKTRHFHRSPGAKEDLEADQCEARSPYGLACLLVNLIQAVKRILSSSLNFLQELSKFPTLFSQDKKFVQPPSSSYHPTQHHLCDYCFRYRRIKIP